MPTPPLPSPSPSPTPSRTTTPTHRTRHTLPSVLMRAGTSKGLFLHLSSLPSCPTHWAPILLAAMGSRLGDPTQLDGVGGATSTTSKVAIVAPSTRAGVDVEYTFAQVEVGAGEGGVDWSGNCGNMAAGVGPFAVDEGLVPWVRKGDREACVRVWNTNTGTIMEARFGLTPEGKAEEDGDAVISGVPGSGAPIWMSFLEPVGEMTGGRMFPTGRRVEKLGLQGVWATLVDVANPFVFVSGATLPTGWREKPGYRYLEALRREAAVRMGLAADEEAAGRTRGTPKIAVVDRPPTTLRWGGTADVDVGVLAFSMGTTHPSLQLTGAVCLAACTTVPGTVPWEIARKIREERDAEAEARGRNTGGREASAPVSSAADGSVQEGEGDGGQTIVMSHPGGVIKATVHKGPTGEEEDIARVTVVRTARRLFEGNVMFFL